MKKAFVTLIALVALMLSVSAFAAEPAHQNSRLGLSAHSIVMSATTPAATQATLELAVDRVTALSTASMPVSPLLQAIHNKDPWSVNELTIATNVTAQSPSLLRCVDTRGTHRLPANYTSKVTVTAATQRTRAVHRPMLS